MKRIIVLLCAVLLLCLSLCSCMNTSAGRVEEKATQAVSGMKPTEHTGDNDRGITTENKDKVKATEDKSNLMETIGDIVATEWDDMVDDGKIEDGDGNVGDLENSDGDGNIDTDAVD